MNGLPAIELRIRNPAEKPGGEIMFYFHQRKPDGTWEVKRQNMLPLLNVNANARTISFEVTHHKVHGGSELGPNAKFRVDLVGPQELRLFKIESGSEGAPV